MAISNTNIFAGTPINSHLFSYEWKNMCKEYEEAMNNLKKLLDEEPLRQTAEQLIITLKAQYNSMYNRLSHSTAFDRSLVAPLPPPIDRKDVKGMLAYRAWDMQVKGTLCPCIYSINGAWNHEYAFADKPPVAGTGGYYDKGNTNGLYAHRLEKFRSNGYGDMVSGLIDCYGIVVEHDDGIIRAEVAHIKMLMLTVESTENNLAILTGLYESLKLTYPLVPVYVITPYQKELIVWREILYNYKAIPERRYK